MRVVLSQNRSAAIIEFVDDRRASRIGEEPLLLGPVDVAAVVIKLAEAFLEARLLSAANEGMEKGRAQIAIALQHSENLDVARREFNALAGTLPAHARAAFVLRIGKNDAHAGY